MVDRWLDRARVPVVVVVGGGELWFMIEGVRGAAPADGLLSEGPISFLGTSVFCGLSKRSREGATSDLGGGGRNRRSPVVGISGTSSLQEVWGPWCNFFFLEGLLQDGWDGCPPYPCMVYLYYWYCTSSLTFNTGML